MMANYTRKAVKAAGLVFVLGIIASFSSYFTRIFLARNLTPEEYGLFYAVFTFVLFVLIFRSLGLGTAVVKFIAQYNVKKDYSKIKTLIVSANLFQLLSSLTIVMVLLLISKYLSLNYFKNTLSFSLMNILTLYIISSLLFSNVKYLLRGFQDIIWFPLAEPLRVVIVLFSIILFFLVGFGIFSPVYGFVVGEIITSLILLIPASKYFFVFKYKIKNFWKTTKELFKFGIPVIFTGMGEKVIAYIDILLLTYFVSLKEVGIYNIILPTATLFLFFARSVTSILLPMVSELWAKKEKVKLSEGLSFIYKYSFVLVIPVMFTVFIFSDIFFRLFFGNQYVSGMWAFRILLIGVLCYIVAQINHSAISGIGKPGTVTRIILSVALINLITNLILIPLYGLTGAAIATSLSYIIALILSTRKLVKYVEITPPWFIWLKALFAGGIFVGIIFYLKSVLVLNPWVELIIALSVAGVVYLISALLLKIVSISEIKKVLKRVI